MPINPSIALSAKAPEAPDLLAQYGRVAAIQQASNQNALAQHQLAAAQREDIIQNTLNRAYQQSIDPTTGAVDINKLRTNLAAGGAGAKIPAVEEAFTKIGKQKIETQSAETKLIDDKLKQSRAMLDTIDPADPNAPMQYLQWHEANHRDPVLGPFLAARGVTADNTRGRIVQAIQAGPQALANLINQSKLGSDYLIQNKPHYMTQDVGGTTQVVAMPGLGGAATVVPGSVAQKTMAPGEAERIKIAQGQLKVAQDRLAAETAIGNISPETIDFVANTYLQTGQLPPLGIGKSAANIKMQVLDRARQLGTQPAAGGAETPAPTTEEAAKNVAQAKQTRAAEQSTLRDFSSGVSARRVTANNTAINHLETMDKLVDDLANTDVRVFNRASNAMAKELGRPAPTSFDAAKQLVASEVIKAVVQNGGGVTERQEAAEQFARANSPQQLKQVINTYRDLLGGQLQSLQLQYETGTNRKDFGAKLTPATKKVLESGAKATPSTAATSATTTFADPDKERRYQEWKLRQTQ